MQGSSGDFNKRAGMCHFSSPSQAEIARHLEKLALTLSTYLVRTICMAPPSPAQPQQAILQSNSFPTIACEQPQEGPAPQQNESCAGEWERSPHTPVPLQFQQPSLLTRTQMENPLPLECLQLQHRAQVQTVRLTANPTHHLCSKT